MEIVQIVPAFPPAVSGVGDYALLLAGEMRANHHLHTRFIVGDPEWDGPPEVDGFLVTKVNARTARSLELLLNEQAGRDVPVLLHYVGYGYERRGCPFWLVKGIDEWRRSTGKNVFVTMFHELFAFGPPWRSSFWTSPWQRQLTARLAELSDSCITNIRRFARYLEYRLGSNSRNVNVFPVFSTIGELSRQELHRRNEMVIFGGAGWREAAYAGSNAELIKLCGMLNVDRIHDIGPRLSNRFELPVEIEWHGPLPAERVSEIMRNARFGFFTYPIPYLGKSTIFAAYASHGLVPITIEENDRTNEDRLLHNTHFLTCNTIERKTDTLSVIGEKAHGWYADHRLAIQADKYASMLTEI